MNRYMKMFVFIAQLSLFSLSACKEMDLLSTFSDEICEMSMRLPNHPSREFLQECRILLDHYYQTFNRSCLKCRKRFKRFMYHITEMLEDFLDHSNM